MQDILEQQTPVVYADKIAQICQPLSLIGIDYFTFIRKFPEQTHLCLTNSPEWHLYFCRSRARLNDCFEAPISRFSTGYFLWSLLGNTSVEKEAKEKFQIQHDITIIEKQRNYCDFHHFGSHPNRLLTSEYYLENMGLLKQFMWYFYEKAYHLITSSDLLSAEHLEENKPIRQQHLSAENREQFNRIVNMTRYYLGTEYGATYLTQRELDCAKGIASGLSAREIGEQLQIAYRTVEVHLNNVKRKLDCRKNSKLILTLAKTHLASLIFG